MTSRLPRLTAFRTLMGNLFGREFLKTRNGAGYRSWRLAMLERNVGIPRTGCSIDWSP